MLFMSLKHGIFQLFWSCFFCRICWIIFIVTWMVTNSSRTGTQQFRFSSTQSKLRQEAHGPHCSPELPWPMFKNFPFICMYVKLWSDPQLWPHCALCQKAQFFWPHGSWKLFNYIFLWLSSLWGGHDQFIWNFSQRWYMYQVWY